MNLCIASFHIFLNKTCFLLYITTLFNRRKFSSIVTLINNLIISMYTKLQLFTIFNNLLLQFLYDTFNIARVNAVFYDGGKNY